jgi:hypothetical protein
MPEECQLTIIIHAFNEADNLEIILPESSSFSGIDCRTEFGIAKKQI